MSKRPIFTQADMHAACVDGNFGIMRVLEKPQNKFDSAVPCSKRCVECGNVIENESSYHNGPCYMFCKCLDAWTQHEPMGFGEQLDLFNTKETV